MSGLRPANVTMDVRSGNQERIAVVTGASGFIGRHLCRRLLDDGWRLRAVDLSPADPGLDPARATVHAVDIRRSAELEPLLAGADAIFHLASAHLQVNAPADWYESINVDAVRGMIETCGRVGVKKVVHVSSVGVYGHVEHPPANEDAPKHPTNEYERTKLLGETAALESARQHRVDLLAVRPGWVYGPGCPRTEKLLRTIRKGRFLFVGSGTNLRHPIYVDDCVEGLLAAQRAEASASGRPYLLVGPRPVTVRELVCEAAEVLDVARPRRTIPRPAMLALAGGVELGFRLIRRQPPISRRSLAFFEHDNAFDGSAARERLGFEAKVDLREGLERTMRGLRRDQRATQGAAS